MSGGTGFIGRHFVYRVLRDDPTTRVTLLVRGRDVEAARARAVKTLESVARDLGERLDEARISSRFQVMLGDVTLPRCGVALETIAALNLDGAPEFWHMAASLNFGEAERERISRHNVEGTENALDLARAFGVRRFVHVSTAYACGDRRGRIEERLHDPEGAFNNFYEHSKCLGEHLVTERAAAYGMDVRILRPSVVVGLSGSFAPSGGETGLYGFARELVRLRRALCKHGAPLRIVGHANATVNLIPVDRVVDHMQALRAADFSGGPIYHLSSAESPTVSDVLDGLCDGVGVPRFEITDEVLSDATPLERLLARRLVFYASYLQNTKIFERHATASVTVPGEHVRSYVSRFVEERESDGAPRVERALEARDGFPLVARAGSKFDRETVVLVNALGMPTAALERLGQSLGTRYNVVTWESRGAPSLAGELDDERAEFARHVEDLEDVMDAYGVSKAHLVGWCTGVDVSLEFARRFPERVTSLVCLNGALMGLSPVRNEFQRNLVKITRSAAQSVEHARVFHGLLAGLMQPAVAPPAGGEAPEFLRAAASMVDPRFSHITSAPLRTPEAFHRYCVLLEHYFGEAPRALPPLRVPALVVSAEDDPISHPAASRLLAGGMPGAELRIARAGGHFLACGERATLDAVLAFLAGQRRAPIAAAPGERRCA